MSRDQARNQHGNGISRLEDKVAPLSNIQLNYCCRRHRLLDTVLPLLVLLNHQQQKTCRLEKFNQIANNFKQDIHNNWILNETVYNIIKFLLFLCKVLQE